MTVTSSLLFYKGKKIVLNKTLQKIHQQHVLNINHLPYKPVLAILLLLMKASPAPQCVSYARKTYAWVFHLSRTNDTKKLVYGKALHHKLKFERDLV
jgi:hypothetical protein